MYPIFLGLGSNLGDRQGNLGKAISMLEEGGFKIIQASKNYETPPWGMEDQPAFLNLVVEGEYQGDPFSLLDLALRIEAECGRERAIHWGPRILDIDILAMGEFEIRSQRLTIPHPFLDQRAFVLLPWTEIAPLYSPPGWTMNIKELLEQLPEEDRESITLVTDQSTQEDVVD